VGVVDDGDEAFSSGVEVACFLDEAGFAFVVVALGFEFEALAEEAQDVVPAVHGAVDDGGDPLFGVVGDEGVFEDGFSGAGFSDEDAESALLGVDVEDVEVALLVGKQRGVFIKSEGVTGESEVGSDHSFLWF